MKNNSLVGIFLISAFVLLFTQGCGQNSAAAGNNASTAEAVSPFKVNVSDVALTDLLTRVRATRWPDKETVADRSQGVRLEKMKALVNYWGKETYKN